jgi:hypothetical protein
VRLRLLTLALGATLTACDSSEIFGPDDFRRLAQAEARWNARPFADYSFEIRTFCFCPAEMAQWTRVSVRNGVVVAADAVEPDPNFPITTLVYWQPIDSLFRDLHHVMSAGPFESPYAEIVVEYDPELGYPTLIEYIEKPTVADAAATIILRNVLPLTSTSAGFLVPAEEDHRNRRKGDDRAADAHQDARKLMIVMR